MKIVGFFGGSFDPIHFGHLNLAIQLVEKKYVDEILFCPAFCSPFKTAQPPMASGRDRLEMIRRVIADIPYFKLCDYEVERKTPSFTIDTLRAIQTEGVQYRLILSQDAARGLSQWKEAVAVQKLAPPLVGLRGEANFPLVDCEVVPTAIFEISSTAIRERLKKKIYCGHLVPQIALDYISEHQLY